MTITFRCEHCGHSFAVDESMAGKHGRCKNCGHEMNVPLPESRLNAPPEAGIAGPRPAHRSGAAAAKTPVSGKPPTERPKLAPGEEPSGAENIPKEFLPESAPYKLDKRFEPPPSAESPAPSQRLMEARAGWRHMVRNLLKTQAWIEEAIYLVLLLFWLIGAYAFLFELKQLAWSMLGPLLICSILLMMLGGFEVFVIPFTESLRHGLAFLLIPPYAIYYIVTRWKKMKRPFRKAISAFLPLILLLGLAWLSRPIRDWFLHSPHKKGETQTSMSVSGDLK
jgi:predicted Zn finger-like uncharacterized protein